MKRINLIILVALIVSLFGASAAFAQEPPTDAPQQEERDGQRGNRGHKGFGIILDALNLEREDLRNAFETAGEDATLTDVIVALGGDADEISELMVEHMIENGVDADDAAERVDEILNTPRGERQDRAPRGERPNIPETEGDA